MVLEGSSKTDIDLSLWSWLSQTTQRGPVLFAGVRDKSAEIWDLLEFSSEKTVKKIGQVPKSTIAVSRIGELDVRVQEVFDSRKHRVDVFMGQETPAFPESSPNGDLHVMDVAVGGQEVLIVGDMTAAGASTGNLHAPLMVLVTRDASVPGAQPLEDEIEPSCSVDKDCAGQPWGIRCQGHFDCVAGKCERECDFKMCGNGVCDEEQGETAASCPPDCAR